MKGMLCAAIQGHPVVEMIADHFPIDQNHINSVLDWMQRQEQPELMLLQNPNPEAEFRAVVFMTSTRSYSYWKSGSPSHIRIWRDFYYQCLFCGMDFLAEVGCTRLFINNPAFPHQWTWDGLACLLEAYNNINRHIDHPAIKIEFTRNTFTKDVVKKLLQIPFIEAHRPIGISAHIHDGLNMRTIFVEKKEIALRKAGIWPSMQ